MQRCFNCMEEFDEKICPCCGYDSNSVTEKLDIIVPGTVIADRYYIGNALGRGGFGITYIAWDKNLCRKVAIKEYLPRGLAARRPGETTVSYDAETKEPFLNGVEKTIAESRQLASFTNLESIVTVFDSFRANGTAYIIMELLEGENAKERLKRVGKFSWDETLKIITPVLEALSEVHKTGIIHRDISPDNIFICDDGKTKLLDFGSARISNPGEERSLSVVLKHGYAPREQYSSKGKQGTWTDVYALCAAMYKMLTGITPVESIERDLHQDELEDIAGLARLPDEAAKALMKGLSIYRKDRIQTVDELKESLFADEKGSENQHDCEETVTISEPLAKNEETELMPHEPETEKASAHKIKTKNKNKSSNSGQKPEKNTKKIIITALISVVLLAGGIVVGLNIYRGNIPYKIKSSGDNGNKIYFYTNQGRKIEREKNSGGNTVNETYYFSDGSLDLVHEYGDGKTKCGKITRYNSDGSLSLVQEFNLNGKEIKDTSYNLNGSIVSVSQFSTNGNKLNETFYNSDGSISSVSEYDSKGNKMKETLYNSDGSISSVSEYDSNGNKMKETSYNSDGSISYVSEFDSNGNKMKETHYYSDGSIFSVSEYDSKGNKIKETVYDYDGSIINYSVSEYDSKGNEIKCTQYNHDGSIFNYSVSEYDSKGNKIKETLYNSDGSIIDYSVSEYDSKGNEIKCTQYNPDGSIIDYSVSEYDSNGNVIKRTGYNSDGSISSVSEYDSNGNLIKRTGYYSDDSISSYVVFEYDGNGNAIKRTSYNSDDSISSYAVFEYDGNGNKIKKTSYNSDGSISYVSEFDSNGNEIKYIQYNSDGSISYVSEFDSNGNVIKRTSYNYDASISDYLD